jgi:ATP-dependent phosphofructokinase / diphosphate-dependent phosphofructokinase
MRVAIGQTGAPTTVVDETVRGLVEGLSAHDVLAVRGGPDGLVDGLLQPVGVRDLPAKGPRGGSWLGAGRRAMTPDDVRRAVEVLARQGIDALALIGGNGTMALLDAIATCAAELGTGLRVVGVPKTIDNDLLHTDHAPGFASAARYLSSVVPDIARDQHAMHRVEPVRVVETLGRAVGWLALAATWHRDDPEHAPDAVLLPEVPLDFDVLVKRVDAALTRKRRAFLVVSEGVALDEPEPLFEAVNHTTLLHGGIARDIAARLSSALGVPARGEVLGMVQRSASGFASAVDVREAAAVGRSAAGLLIDRPDDAVDIGGGTDAVMVATVREPADAYAVHFATVPLVEVAGRTRKVPERWRTDDPAALGDFYDWLAPLIT